jgi:hypothetical protein
VSEKQKLGEKVFNILMMSLEQGVL